MCKCLIDQPKLYFDPPSSSGIYVVEQERSLALTCIWNQNIYPPVTGINVSRTTGG